MRPANRRRSLWLGLAPLLGVFLLGLTIGTVELVIWCSLMVAWVVLFFTWANPKRG